jgi:uncharacterized protein YjiS (DUF1127 family)
MHCPRRTRLSAGLLDTNSCAVESNGVAQKREGDSVKAWAFLNILAGMETAGRAMVQRSWAANLSMIDLRHESTTFVEPGSKVPAGRWHGLRRGPQRVVHLLRLREQRIRSRRQLQVPSHHILRDFGITPEKPLFEGSKSPWQYRHGDPCQFVLHGPIPGHAMDGAGAGRKGGDAS